jgi:DNA-binding response OmpR family regulator
MFMIDTPTQKKLLIIEDDPDILDILKLIFQSEGYIVYTSLNGEKTQQVIDMAPDLILLDLRLSAFGKEGAEICKRLKAEQLTRQIPVILLSAETDIRIVCSTCGANDYMRKPFDVDRLTSKVKDMILI